MNLLPKSEKWLPVIVIVWACVMITLAFYAAWIDPLRYIEMINAIGKSIEIAGAVTIGAVAYWSKIRMDYKAKLSELNPYFGERYRVELGIKKDEGTEA